MKAIIIDGIKDHRESLRVSLETHCTNVEVIGEAMAEMDGLKLLKIEQPDILFLTIRMNDGSGFDLMEILKDVPFKVVFITVPDKFLEKAFKFSALEYLVKPVNLSDLKMSVTNDKSKIAGQREGIKLLMEIAKGNLKKLRKISLHTPDKIIVVNLEDIIRCESNGNHTHVYLFGGKKISVTRSLKNLKEMLQEDGFYSVHPSHLVNAKHIREFTETNGGHLIMSDISSVPVSSPKSPELIQLLKQSTKS